MDRIERSWNNKTGGQGKWKPISDDVAKRELANKFGDKALAQLAAFKTLETQYAKYRITVFP